MITGDAPIALLDLRRANLTAEEGTLGKNLKGTKEANQMMTSANSCEELAATRVLLAATRKYETWSAGRWTSIPLTTKQDQPKNLRGELSKPR